MYSGVVITRKENANTTTWFESYFLRPQKSLLPKPENSVTLLKFRVLKITGSYYIYIDMKSLDISCFLCRCIFLYLLK